MQALAHEDGATAMRQLEHNKQKSQAPFNEYKSNVMFRMHDMFAQIHRETGVVDLPV
jgi:hypothetical protein